MLLRRILATAVLAVAAASTVATAHSSAAGPAEEAAFLADLDDIPGLWLWTEEELLDVGYLTCQALDTRGATEETVRGLIELGKAEGGDYEMQMILASSVKRLCPQHELGVFEAFKRIQRGL